MKQYCLGFAMCGNTVVLIRKTHPFWMAGKLNGIGGLCEPGESPEIAMCREWAEETGEAIRPAWLPLAKISGDGFVVHCFYAECKELAYRTVANHDVKIYFIGHSDVYVDNTELLIQLARADVQKPVGFWYGSILSKIKDDMEEYEALCEYYNEEVQSDHSGPKCYGEHSNKLKRWRSEGRPPNGWPQETDSCQH